MIGSGPVLHRSGHFLYYRCPKIDNYTKKQYRWYIESVISCTTCIRLDQYDISKLSQDRREPLCINAGESVFWFYLRIALKDA